MKHSEIKEYYERRYSELQEETFPADEVRYRAWFRKLSEEKNPKGKLLDIGCGVGHACSFFSNLGYAVAGVDISAEAIAFAQKREPRGTFEVAKESGELPFPNNAYNLVTCLGVLEHIPRPEMTLREMQRVCHADGVCVLVVPNIGSPYFWFDKGTGQIEENPRTLAGWKLLLEQNGWKIEDMFRDPGPLNHPIRGIGGHLKRLALKLTNCLPFSLTYQFVIYARPIKQV